MIKSYSRPLYSVEIPEYLGEIKMLPFDLNNLSDIPNLFKDMVTKMIEFLPLKEGIAFFTVDGRVMKPGKTHRRGGKHIDGNYLFKNSWGNTGSGWSPPETEGPSDWKVGGNGKLLTKEQHKLSYESQTGGMIIASDQAQCKGWNGIFNGNPGIGGDCRHIKTTRGFILEPDMVYYGSSQFVHESLPAKLTVHRTLVRITLPLDYPVVQ